jgi:nucleotide-binding universal stress UspA family protein
VFGPSVVVAYDAAADLRDAEKVVTDVAGAARRRYPGLVVDRLVTAADPGRLLVDESYAAALVVVGPPSRVGLLGILTGSVSSHVAAHAHAPVVVLRDPGHEADRSPDVVVGVDGSPGSAAAVEFAYAEAAARGGALIAVYAWTVLPSHNLGPINRHHYDMTEARQEADRVLAEQLAGWPEKYPDIAVIRRAVHSLDPARTLMDQAYHAALLVVGPRGHHTIAELLLGSVSAAVVRHCPVPVAVAHPRDPE